jgi:glycosyltransferase involved in cell wall biosynthesis
MRIGLVVSGGVDRSGRERVIPSLIWLIERLARDHDVIVYVLRYHESPCSYTVRGATVRDLGSPRGAWRQHQALHGALCADGVPDILHAYWALPAGLAAVGVGRRLGVPTIVTCDSGEFARLPAIDYGLQCRMRQRVAVATTIRLATRVTVCSRFQQSLARAHGASPLVIPFGIDRGVFTRVTRPDGPPWRLIQVANLNPVKDHATSLHALRRIVDAEPRVHLDLVGLDTQGGQTTRLCEALGLADHVTFHGSLPNDDIVPLYHQAHLAVLTSRHEAAGVVTLEAAACGVPTVGTAVGYLHDWAPQRAAAVPPADADALSARVLDLLGRPDERAALAEAAYSWTIGHDADFTARELVRLYHELRAA